MAVFKNKKNKLLASKPRRIPAPRAGDAVQCHQWLCVPSVSVLCSPEGFESWKERGGGEINRILGGFSALWSWLGSLLGVQPSGWGFRAVDGRGIARSCQGDPAKACKGGRLEGKSLRLVYLRVLNAKYCLKDKKDN